MKVPPPKTSRGENNKPMTTAKLKSTIEAAWRACGAQVFVRIDNGCIRSTLRNGLPASLVEGRDVV